MYYVKYCNLFIGNGIQFIAQKKTQATAQVSKTIEIIIASVYG